MLVAMETDRADGRLTEPVLNWRSLTELPEENKAELGVYQSGLLSYPRLAAEFFSRS
jgi:hypothetical protein